MQIKPQEDTIAAIASGVGGSITILRISGVAALDVAGSVWRGRHDLATAPPRTLHLGKIHDATGQPVDTAIAVYMPGPNSYTGEDVVEIHTHGGPMVARLTLESLLRVGARHAEAGEFTKRAFINGKLDLTQAEAVADIITAHSEMALHAANRQLDGRLGQRINSMLDTLTEILAEIEVRMDFVDEDLDWRSHEELETGIGAAVDEVRELLAHSEEGRILRQGIRVVIAGAPNAGKSSLMNLILGQDRAIVTNIPGTTRDTLEELAHIRSVPVHLTDTAGLRETKDEVEQHGVKRSYSSIQQAQVVLRILDSTRPLSEQALDDHVLNGKNVVVVANKNDLEPDTDFAEQLQQPVYPLCANTGKGLPAILDAVEAMIWGDPNHAEPDVAVNARHSSLLSDALGQLEEAKAMVSNEDFELIAINLRTAIDAIGRVTGRSIQPDILDYIFSQFCIGK